MPLLTSSQELPWFGDTAWARRRTGPREQFDTLSLSSRCHPQNELGTPTPTPSHVISHLSQTLSQTRYQITPHLKHPESGIQVGPDHRFAW